MPYLTKIKNWFVAMITTRNVMGTPFMFFQTVYFLYSIKQITGKLNKNLAQNIQTFINKKFDREVVIKNSLGYFSINPTNDSLTKSLSSFEYHHQPWLKTPKQKRIFIDIGSNIGFYSIFAIKKMNYEKAYSFEPNPQTFSRLKRNIDLNKLKEKINLFTYALSNTNGTDTLYTKSYHTGASSISDFRNTADTSKTEIKTKTFDTFTKEQEISLSKIDFIKIDVEGFEANVIEGMKNSLPKLNPRTCLFIEIDPKQQHSEEVKNTIKKHDFRLLKQSKQHNYLYIKA